MNNIIIYVCYLLSFIAGSLLSLVFIFKTTHGTLVIDETGEKSNWSFLVERPIDDFKRNKLVVFKVKNKTSR